MKRDLEVQVNELQSELSREQTEVSRLRDHNSQLRNQLSDKENKQVKVTINIYDYKCVALLLCMQHA